MNVKANAWWDDRLWEAELRGNGQVVISCWQPPPVSIEKKYYGKWDDWIYLQESDQKLDFDVVQRLSWALDAMLGSPRLRKDHLYRR